MKIPDKIIILALILSAFGPAGFTLTQEDIANELVCQCGCGLVLENCNHTNCGVAIPMRELINEKIAAGETKEQIIRYFVDKYGEVVLAAPPKEGFNLTVWVLPFASIIVGAGILVFLILLWVRQRRLYPASWERSDNTVQSPEKNKAYEQTFNQELKDFE